VPLAKLLEQHFSEVESVIGAKGLKPRLVNESAGHVRIDAQLFGRILRNLTHNAIKFTEQGEVAIRSRDDGDAAVVTIRDTGCGIATEHQQDVFLEFYQAGNPERDRSKGLGLGLSIVDRLCRLLGIAIALRSVPGQGTEFELRLPRVAPPSAAAGSGASAALTPRDWGLHVLIVDDERSVRTGMRMLLEELGCTCDEAGSTEQACELAQLRRPDLVLADFRLRGEDSGLRALEALDRLLGGVTGVLVSGDTAPQRLREARNAGRRLLHKPLALAELQQELKSALGRRQHRTEGPGDGATQGAAAHAG
jgi:CheY-like chemotaxis protein